MSSDESREIWEEIAQITKSAGALKASQELMLRMIESQDSKADRIAVELTKQGREISEICGALGEIQKSKHVPIMENHNTNNASNQGGNVTALVWVAVIAGFVSMAAIVYSAGVKIGPRGITVEPKIEQPSN